MKSYENRINNWSNVFFRTTGAPLDLSATFGTIAALQTYVNGLDDSVPYLGQVVSVENDGNNETAVYIITAVGNASNSHQGSYKRLALQTEIGNAGSLFNWQGNVASINSTFLNDSSKQSGYAYRYSGVSAGTIPQANMASGEQTTVNQNDIIICVVGKGDTDSPSTNTFLVIDTGIAQGTIDSLKADFVNALKISVSAEGTYDSANDWYQGCISTGDVTNLITLYGDITTTTLSDIKPSSLAITFAANADDELFKEDGTGATSLIASTGFNITAHVHATTLTSAEAEVYDRALEVSFHKGGYIWVLKIMFNSSDNTKSCIKSNYIKYND